MSNELKPCQACTGRAGRVQKYLSDQAAAKENLATYPESIRVRLLAWQESQREFFMDTILEIVAEFIAFEDCCRAQSAADAVEAVAAAIEAAQCHGREGPFGGYDYGYPDDRPVEGGRYVIRDFRDPGSTDWGKWLHQTNDREAHEAALSKMTREHVARAAIAAMLGAQA